MNLTPVSSGNDYRRTPIASEPTRTPDGRTNLAVLAPFDVLAHPLGLQVARRWSKPCEAAFDYILERSPLQLVALINQGELDPPDLTFAAEILGRCSDGSLVREALVPLLEHDSAVVREGAVYGLTRHLNAEVTDRLRLVASHDASPGVQAAALDALNE